MMPACLFFLFFFFLSSVFFFPLPLASRLAAGNLVPPRPALTIGCPQSAVRSSRRAPCAPGSAPAVGSAARPARGVLPALRMSPFAAAGAAPDEGGGARGVMEPQPLPQLAAECGGARRDFSVKHLLRTGDLYGEHYICM